jgi:hypothetical protein
MKRCPACHRTYADDTLSFCLDDGSPLFTEGAGASSDMAATIIMPDPRVTVPEKQETFSPPPRAPYPPTTPPPQAWPPVAAQLNRAAASPIRQGRGAAVTSLVLAVVSFFLLGFCIIGGATKVDDTLIGGIFLFSVLLALGGAILGIVAVSKSSKDTSPQNGKALSLIALVLNCLYLLITVIFLIVGAVAGSG